jgi:hypothetical protein
MTNKKKPQADKFREAARQLETDDDEERFNEKLRRLARQKPGSLTDDADSESMDTDDKPQK